LAALACSPPFEQAAVDIGANVRDWLFLYKRILVRNSEKKPGHAMACPGDNSVRAGRETNARRIG